MKYILFLIAISTTFLGQTQHESVFGNQETSWKSLSLITDLFEPTFEHRTYTTNSANDTIVNGETYKRYWFNSNEGQLRFEMKEDTTTGKVWMGMLDVADTMFLKFDLSLNVGDTFYFHSPIDTGIVQNVYYLNNKKHIEFDITHYTSNTPLTFIEGLGPTTGFISSIISPASLEFSSYIICQEKDALTTYVNPITNDCSFLHTLIQENEESQVQIYPNPIISKGIIRVKLQEPINQKNMKIFDILGKQVTTHIITKLNNQSYEIELPTFKPGKYTLQIQTSVSVITKKIVVL